MQWVESKNKATFYDIDGDGNDEKVLPTNKIKFITSYLQKKRENYMY